MPILTPFLFHCFHGFFATLLPPFGNMQYYTFLLFIHCKLSFYLTLTMSRDTTNPQLTFFLNISLIYRFTSCFFLHYDCDSRLVSHLLLYYNSYYKEIVIVV